jgi:predicted TIM-barrel fold metal-dependent hydrolase
LNGQHGTDNKQIAALSAVQEGPTMQTTEIADGLTGEDHEPAMERAVIDCDIHHYTGFKAIEPYMPRAYKEYMATYGTSLPNGSPVGGAVASVSDLTTLQERHLTPNHIRYGILTGESYGMHGTHNYEYAAAICSAINDYTLEHWLSRDQRLRGSIFIPKQEPHLSVQEIDRVAGHSAMVQVIVSNGAHLPYGNRYYDPIYEACVRHQLPLMIHAGMEGQGSNNATTGAGFVTHQLEWQAARTQVMMAHLASLIFNGVFERFPELRIVLHEAGTFWISPYLWRLDQDWKGLRVQTPWVKKFPSEYFHTHCRVTTQSMEKTPNDETFEQFIQSINASDTMMFCSNFPYKDFKSQVESWPRMDEALQERVFYKNAEELYKLPPAHS